MTPEMAVKVTLLLNSPGFMADLEKTASDLKFNDDQKAASVLEAASAMNLSNIEKQAAGPGGMAVRSLIPTVSDAMRAHPWKTGIGATVMALLGAAGDHLAFKGGVSQEQVKQQIQDAIAKRDAASSGLGGFAGAGIGALGGGLAGHALASDTDDYGQERSPMTSMLGTGLGAAAGGVLGNMAQKNLFS